MDYNRHDVQVALNTLLIDYLIEVVCAQMNAHVATNKAYRGLRLWDLPVGDNTFVDGLIPTTATLPDNITSVTIPTLVGGAVNRYVKIENLLSVTDGASAALNVDDFMIPYAPNSVTATPNLSVTPNGHFYLHTMPTGAMLRSQNAGFSVYFFANKKCPCANG